MTPTPTPAADPVLLDWDKLTRRDVAPEERDIFDAMRAFDARIDRILAANGGEVMCPRCKRSATGWPLKRGDRCSEDRAVECMRDPAVVLADIARRALANFEG